MRLTTWTVLQHTICIFRLFIWGTTRCARYLAFRCLMYAQLSRIGGLLFLTGTEIDLSCSQIGGVLNLHTRRGSLNISYNKIEFVISSEGSSSSDSHYSLICQTTGANSEQSVHWNRLPSIRMLFICRIRKFMPSGGYLWAIQTTLSTSILYQLTMLAHKRQSGTLSFGSGTPRRTLAAITLPTVLACFCLMTRTIRKLPRVFSSRLCVFRWALSWTRLDRMANPMDAILLPIPRRSRFT